MEGAILLIACAFCVKLSYIFSRFHGSGKGTAVNSMKDLIFQCLTCQVHLLFSGVIQGDVRPATKDLTHIPGRHYMTSRTGIRIDLLQHPSDLINVPSISRWPGAPLIAVNGTQVAVLVGPFVPDRHTIFVKRMDVRVTFQKPEQFADN